jgi:hypothetical protein
MNWTTHNLQRIMCGLRGHEAVLHFERHRLSLRCLNCGHETTGWILESETRHAARLTDSQSHAHISGFGRWHTLLKGIGVSLASRLSRARHAVT